MADGRWPMADGRWPMADGRWPMADGRWPMADGRWPMADGRWPMADGRWPMASLYAGEAGAAVKPAVTASPFVTTDGRPPGACNMLDLPQKLRTPRPDMTGAIRHDSRRRCQPPIATPETTVRFPRNLRNLEAGNGRNRRGAAMAASGIFRRWPVDSGRIATAFGAGVSLQLPGITGTGGREPRRIRALPVTAIVDAWGFER